MLPAYGLLYDDNIMTVRECLATVLQMPRITKDDDACQQ